VLALLHYQQSTAKDQGAAVGGWSEHGRRQPGRRRALFLFSSSRIGFWPLGREATSRAGLYQVPTNQSKSSAASAAHLAPNDSTARAMLYRLSVRAAASVLSLSFSLFSAVEVRVAGHERERHLSRVHSRGQASFRVAERLKGWIYGCLLFHPEITRRVPSGAAKSFPRSLVSWSSWDMHMHASRSMELVVRWLLKRTGGGRASPYRKMNDTSCSRQ
jgi:hypothetical protein